MASYRQAIRWIVLNDDTAWLEDGNGSISVTAALVADLFRKTDYEVTADLRAAVVKERRDRNGKAS